MQKFEKPNKVLAKKISEKYNISIEEVEEYFLTNKEGKYFPIIEWRYKRMLEIYKKYSLQTEIIRLDIDIDKKRVYCVCRATVTVEKGIYTAFGTGNYNEWQEEAKYYDRDTNTWKKYITNTCNLQKFQVGYCVEMAETRAIARAFKNCLGDGLCTMEELNEKIEFSENAGNQYKELKNEYNGKEEKKNKEHDLQKGIELIESLIQDEEYKQYYENIKQKYWNKELKDMDGNELAHMYKQLMTYKKYLLFCKEDTKNVTRMLDIAHKKFKKTPEMLYYPDLNKLIEMAENEIELEKDMEDDNEKLL